MLSERPSRRNIGGVPAGRVTEGHSTCILGMSELARSGYRHSEIVHKNREFARDGPDGRVSTNAVEGLFSRVKRFLRITGSKKVGRSKYGPVLGEFLWREACLSERR